jgi:hypothetical protein
MGGKVEKCRTRVRRLTEGREGVYDFTLVEGNLAFLCKLYVPPTDSPVRSDVRLWGEEAVLRMGFGSCLQLSALDSRHKQGYVQPRGNTPVAIPSMVRVCNWLCSVGRYKQRILLNCAIGL